MKHVVSVSLGSSDRDKSVELDILGQRVLIDRIGTNGDLKRAAKLIQHYDGKVDAIGLGGADFGMQVNKTYYPLHSVKHLKNYAITTSITDGIGLKQYLESNIANYLETILSEHLNTVGRTALLVNSISRWGMAKSFIDGGYKCTYGDLMFSLGIPLPIHSEKKILLTATLLCPVVTRLPFKWIYPINEEENIGEKAYSSAYHKVSVIAGDCLYIKQALPKMLEGKIIVTNTTTDFDVELFKQAGVSSLITTTPVIEGRTFGTNVLEAVILAISGNSEALSASELMHWIGKIDLKPQYRKLN